MSQIWVAGEALVDIFSGADQKEVIGGAAANTAKALGALDLDVQFIGCISNDKYGLAIREELNNYSVKLDFVNKSLLPTATAKVVLNTSKSAEYIFHLEQTATFSFDKSWLPQSSPNILHIGSLATVIEPGATELFEWAKTRNCPIIFDPNIRSSIIKDRNIYQSRVIPWLQISKIIKLSEEDLSYLRISISELFNLGADLVILTRGIQGISAFTASFRIDSPAYVVNVRDTIGAGDTVGAITAEVLNQKFDLGKANLNYLIKRASLAASITCSKDGAKPPSRSELRI